MCVHWEEAKVCNGNEQPEILRCAVQVVLRLAKMKDASKVHGCVCLTCHKHTHSGSALSCGHAIAMDLCRLDLYCRRCNDVIYDAEFDQAKQEAMTSEGIGTNGKLNAEKALPRQPDSGPNSAESEQPTYIQSGENGVLSEIQIMKQSRQAGSKDGLPAGLRALVNLGNTCFMSTVLHAILHAPSLRDFYLGGGHPPSSCSQSIHSRCLSCELNAVFSAMYSGERKPYSPANFLASWWQHSDSLAGYQQQDAHEFYLFALSGLDGSRVTKTPTPAPSDTSCLISGLPRDNSSNFVILDGSDSRTADDVSRHEGSKSVVIEDQGNGMMEKIKAERQSSPAPRISGQINSVSTETEGTREEGIIERAFEGALRSDICCGNCGFTSTTHEAFLALSMDIDAPQSLPNPILKPDPAFVKSSSPITKNGKKLVGAALAASKKKALKQERAHLKLNKSQNLPVTPSPSTTDSRRGKLGGSEDSGSLQTDPALLSRLNQTYANDLSTVTNGFSMDARNSQDSSIVPVGASHTVSYIQMTGQGNQNGISPQSNALKGKPQVKRQKTVRCGECHTCRNKHLKKACLRNVEMRKRAELEANAPQFAAKIPDVQNLEQFALGQSENFGATHGQHVQGSHNLSQLELPDNFLPQNVFRENVANRGGQFEGKCDPTGSPICAGKPMSNLGFQTENANRNVSGGIAQAQIQLKTLQTPQTNLEFMDRKRKLEASNSESPEKKLKVESSPEINDMKRKSDSPLLKSSEKKAKIGPSSDRILTASSPGKSEKAFDGDFNGSKIPVLDSLTLTGCLKRYTRPESVPKWTCEACGAKCGKKQVSVRVLPQVLCFHIKRFRHAGSKGQGHKIASFVKYPQRLDMEPFLTANLVQQKFKNPGAPSWKKFAANIDKPCSNYELYCIVCHGGNLKGGHYIAYLRCDAQWYECNDSSINAVDDVIALNAQAYLLFYKLQAS